MILCFPSQNTLSTQFFVIKCIYFIDGLTHFLTIDCPYFSRDCREIYQDFAIIGEKCFSADPTIVSHESAPIVQDGWWDTDFD